MAEPEDVLALPFLANIRYLIRKMPCDRLSIAVEEQCIRFIHKDSVMRIRHGRPWIGRKIDMHASLEKDGYTDQGDHDNHHNRDDAATTSFLLFGFFRSLRVTSDRVRIRWGALRPWANIIGTLGS